MSYHPNPGSKEARDLGCTCPVLDNAHGRGYMGGAKDTNGDTVFVYRAGCVVHDPIVSPKCGSCGYTADPDCEVCAPKAVDAKERKE